MLKDHKNDTPIIIEHTDDFVDEMTGNEDK